MYFFPRKLLIKKITAAILSIQSDTKENRCEIHGTTSNQILGFYCVAILEMEALLNRKCECSVLILGYK